MEATEEWLSTVVTRARAFAIGAHAAICQKMPYTGEAYSVHLEAVATLYGQFTTDRTSLAAAWLHDVLEDTGVTYETLLEEFGIQIATTVRMVSKISKRHEGNRASRAALDLTHYANGTASAQDLKLVDSAINVKTIVERDPSFAAVYVNEKRDLLKVLTKGDVRIWTYANQAVENALLDLERLGYR